uniref:Uncharacterized protein n=1 Tax=Spongospora subterranea TaxID=70186 RepID=A0A0H5QQ15_9EUKA|eukprot:CRZ03712.1 hypothetical protein [Spongospora subterranea]
MIPLTLYPATCPPESPVYMIRSRRLNLQVITSQSSLLIVTRQRPANTPGRNSRIWTDRVPLAMANREYGLMNSRQETPPLPAHQHCNQLNCSGMGVSFSTISFQVVVNLSQLKIPDQDATRWISDCHLLQKPI